MQTPDTPSDARIPTAVAWLGYGGLLPFVSLALAVWVQPSGGVIGILWHTALLAYGAVILSFVGALHWGLAMADPHMQAATRTRCFVWSVVPALLAWPVLLVGPVVGTVILMVGFAAHLAQDLLLANKTTLPRWYLSLRLRLTSVACASLLAAAMSA